MSLKVLSIEIDLAKSGVIRDRSLWRASETFIEVCPSSILWEPLKVCQGLLFHQLAIMNAIANGGPKNPHSNKCSLLKFPKAQGIHCTSSYRWKHHSDVINSLRLCQSLHDVDKSRSWPLAIGTEVPNCQSGNKLAQGNFKGLSIDWGQAKFTEISAPLPLIETLLSKSLSMDSTFKYVWHGNFSTNMYITMYCTYNLLPLFKVRTSVPLLFVQKLNSWMYYFLRFLGIILRVLWLEVSVWIS